MPGCPPPQAFQSSETSLLLAFLDRARKEVPLAAFLPSPQGVREQRQGWAGDCLPTAWSPQGLRSLWIHLKDMPYGGVNPPNTENAFGGQKKLDKIAQWGEESAIIIPCCSKKTTGGNCQLCYILLSSAPRRMVVWGSELQGIDLSKLLTKTYTIPPKSRVFR